MSYGTNADFIKTFGPTNVNKWAARENDNGEDIDDLLTDARSAADAEIDDMLRDGPYQVPLTFLTTASARRVRHWSDTLMAYELLLPRLVMAGRDAGGGDSFAGIERARKHVMSEINDVLMGSRKLNATTASDRGEQQPTGVY